MESNQTIHVWRAVGTPQFPPTKGRCFYCEAPLETGGKLHELSIKKRKEEIKQAEVEWFGNYLDKMSDAEWERCLKKNELSNKESIARGVDDWLVPEDKENYLDYFYLVIGETNKYSCNRCGWWKDFSSGMHGATGSNYAAAVMQTFSLDDAELTLQEITSHLSRRFSDIYTISPRKFEELVADVYKNAGWDATLTKRSRDGGVDIICLSKNGETCLVECKRYSDTRSVGISAVDRLLGVAYRNDAPFAHLVTTSKFSSPARQVAKEVKARNGIELSLIDAHDLSVMLDLYSDKSLTVSELENVLSYQLKKKKT